MQPGVMAGGARIPLLGKITPDSSYSIANAYIYTIHMSVLIQLLTNLFMTIHIQNIFTIFTYCIIPTDYIPTQSLTD